MNNYIIGVDGGATKTIGVLFSPMGEELKRTVKGYSNFSVNEEESIIHILEVIDELTSNLGDNSILRIQIGIAGYTNYSRKEKLDVLLKERYNTSIDVITDAEIALYSVKRNSEQNVIMILGGTGSVIMLLENNEMSFIGGFGHLLGDEGSGYHLAITALRNIIAQFEDKKSPTKLTMHILEHIKAKDYSDIKKFVYNRQKNEIAELQLIIAEYAQKDNKEAIKLFIDEGVLLSKQAVKAYKMIDTEEEVIIGIKGGFLLNAPYVKETLIRELNKENIMYKLDANPIEPVYGAYYLAKQYLDRGDLW